MLTRPEITDDAIRTCLLDHFEVDAVAVDFLPLGGDVGSAVFRVSGHDDRPYFCKLRREPFDETSVSLPRFLSDNGVTAIIAPLRSRAGRLRVPLGDFSLILYPFVAGTEGYEVALSARQWADFGAALRRVHALAPPPDLRPAIHVEDYSAEWRNRCWAVMQRVAGDAPSDDIAQQMAALLNGRRAAILAALDRAEQLAARLAAQPPPPVICHGDLHPGNLHIGQDDQVYLVDWDYPLLAPKERDLMFIGGGQGFMAPDPASEERSFYAGYGEVALDRLALTYYRYERGLTDLTVESERILSTRLGRADRAQALAYLGYYCDPGNTLEIAAAGDVVG